jgi:uncharacterized protein (DUF169 family)
MDIAFRQRFAERWEAYFPGSALPIAFYYTDERDRADPASSRSGFRCLICDLAEVRDGTSLRLGKEAIGCSGARRYLGFETEMRPNFAYFLSCGIPGEMEGERYKQSPELVEEYLASQPTFEAPGRYIVFKRWDKLDERDDPAVVIFFAPPNVLSGLFTLANFDETDPQAVIAPFSSGCSSIVYHPYQEIDAERPRAVLGMFDVSARPCVSPDVLTFAVPWPKFVRMVETMDKSFLITDSWHRVRSRIQQGKERTGNAS